MQLRHYLAIVQRFWLLFVILPLAVGLVSVGVELAQPTRFAASGRLLVSQAPHTQDQTTPFPDFNLQYSWQSSEYILDDLPQVVTSAVFAQDVADLLARQGTTIAPSAVQGGLRAESFHRSVTLNAVAANPETARAIVGGAMEALQTYGLKYWARNAPAGGLSIAVLDPPRDGGPVRSTRSLALDIALRVALGLAAALGLAFLLSYLDDTLRDRHQAEEWTGMRVMGVIPKE